MLCIDLVNNLAYTHDSYTIHPTLDACHFMCYSVGKFILVRARLYNIALREKRSSKFDKFGIKRCVRVVAQKS